MIHIQEKSLQVLMVSLSAASLMTACGGGGSDAPTTAAPTALESAKTFLASYDAVFASAVPTSGAAFYSLTDGCFLNGGLTKALAIANFDANFQTAESSRYQVGSTRTNITVLADRAITNPDGSMRRELDVQYQVNYADGSVNKNSGETLIYGSSSGSTLAGGAACSTPDNQNAWRRFGNRRVVTASVSAVNSREQHYSLSNGAPLNPAVTYSRYLSFTVSDPSNAATYAVITGPGLIGGVKMLSPRVLRTDPLLAGKPGNFVDWRDTDSFSMCRTATNATDATQVDCAQYGASGNTVGMFGFPPNLLLTADMSFSISGFADGAVYAYAIYNDDGWKSVNGQAGKTPVVTYTATLNRLPYSLVAMGSADGVNDLFPQFQAASVLLGSIYQPFSSKTAATYNLPLRAVGALPDSTKFGLGIVSTYEAGRATAGAAAFPASRQSSFVYPAAGATSVVLPIPTPTANMMTPTFAEIAIAQSDHNGRTIVSTVRFD